MVVPLSHRVLHLKLALVEGGKQLEEQRELPLLGEGPTSGVVVIPEVCLKLVDCPRQLRQCGAPLARQEDGHLVEFVATS